jgi:hypothetical protein
VLHVFKTCKNTFYMYDKIIILCRVSVVLMRAKCVVVYIVVFNLRLPIFVPSLYTTCVRYVMVEYI